MHTNHTPPAAPGAALRVFALDDTRGHGERVCAALGVAPSAHEARAFEDGEYKARPLGEVRGCDCFVIQSLHGGPDRSADDKLCRLLFFIATLRDAGAERVSAVIPYLAYARKDRRTRADDPVMTRYVATLFEAVGTDLVMTLDVHNLAAFDNAFRCRTEHLEARALLVREASALVAEAPVTVVAPDSGALQRAGQFRRAGCGAGTRRGDGDGRKIP